MDRENTIIVTDPPFNIGYHYNEYNDKMDEVEYYTMLANLVRRFPCVIIHYPESLHRLSLESGEIPTRVCSWVYNSNTARQHRDIAWYRVKPDFTKALQPYKNPNDKRIKERMARGLMGGRMYDWWNVNQVKNVNRDKTKHPCQMPLEVMKNIISTLPENKTIFDPFMGSGTTARAARRWGRHFVGFELNPDYIKIIEKKVQVAVDMFAE